jgi:hypothetical protein
MVVRHDPTTKVEPVQAVVAVAPEDQAAQAFLLEAVMEGPV